jgi:uncharacterized protein
MKLKLVSRDLRSLFTLLILLAAAVAAWGQDNANFSIDTSPLPAPTGFVNDFAGVIDAATKQQLEAKITQFKQSTNPQVELAVAVVKTTGDRDIFDYSLAVARGWKIGSKADDNPSALLFIATDDRKYFTQVSRDLEDELPDSLAGSIQRQYLVPEFKKGNYSKGISDTIDAYIKTIQSRSSRTAAPAAGTSGTDSGTSGIGRSGFNLFCCFIVFIVLMVIIFSRGHGKDKNDKNRWGGGGGFGGGGSALPWIIGSILSSGGGGSSSSSNWGGSSGGGWGGFGGGGDFGGGGAGGSW